METSPYGFVHLIRSKFNSKDRKVSIFGAGRVGAAIGYILLLRKLTSHLVFIDPNKSNLDSQVLGFEPYSIYFDNAIVEGTCDDYSKLADSRICIMAAGGRILPGETKMDMLQKNVETLRAIVTHIMRYCPDCIFLIVTSPVDIISYFAWKMTKFPANRIIGVVYLYSKPFQYEVAKHFKVNQNAVNALVVGEYGDSAVPLWSSVNIAGVCIKEINPLFGSPSDPEKSLDLFKELLNIPHKISILKGYSTWSPGLCVSKVVQAIMFNTNELIVVSTLAKGVATIDKNIFLALPCEIGRNGVVCCVVPNLDENELKKFEKSADVIDKKIKKCMFWTIHSSNSL